MIEMIYIGQKIAFYKSWINLKTKPEKSVPSSIAIQAILRGYISRKKTNKSKTPPIPIPYANHQGKKLALSQPHSCDTETKLHEHKHRPHSPHSFSFSDIFSPLHLESLPSMPPSKKGLMCQ